MHKIFLDWHLDVILTPASLTLLEINPAVSESISYLLGLDYIGDQTIGRVCLENSKEVRFEFRTAFRHRDLIDYIYHELTVTHKLEEGDLLGLRESIMILFPDSPLDFWQTIEKAIKDRDR